MRTQRWGRLLLAVMLLALLFVRQQESQAAPEMQSGGAYFDDVTVNGSLDIYGAGVIRDSLGDTVQAAATAGRWTLAGNATSANLYAGSTGNAVAAGLYGTVIAGGGTGSTGTWGQSGTFYNVINSQGNFATIGGGLKNSISGGYAVIDGGQSNTIDQAGWWGVIGGGQTNRVMRTYGVVAGGYGNTSDNGGAVLGGTQNASRAQYSANVAGYKNEVDSVASMGWIGGGYCNTVGTGNACLGTAHTYNRVAIGTGTANYGVVLGGDRNAVNGYMDWIGNGFYNTIADMVTSTVTGAYTSTALWEVMGTPANSINGQYNFNTSIATCHTSQNVIGGGQFNVIANASVLTYTQIISNFSEITPALVVSCNGGYGYIGTGVSNTITGTTAQYATVLNGYENAATGQYATVLNGYQSRADGAYSFAAGYQAWARHAGAFVWGGSGATVYQSVAPDSFNVRASGGVTMTTSGAGLALDGPVIVDGMAFTYTSPITITGVLTNVRLLFYQVP